MARVDDKIGATLLTEEGQALFVHVSEASDKGESLAQVFGPASRVPTVRVVDHYHYSNVSKASALTAVVTAPVLSYSDLSVGQKTVGTVKALSKSGVVVSIGPNVQALCPLVHLHDAPRKAVNEKEFKVGDKFPCRVLHASSSKCHVTRKPALMKVKSPVSSPSVPPNTVAKGTVTAVSAKGVAVTFFGRVYGFCTAAALALERGVDDPEENYTVGQLVDVRVVESGKSPLSLSFDTESKEVRNSESEATMLRLISISPLSEIVLISLVAFIYSSQLPKPKEGKLTGKVKPGDVVTEVKVVKSTDEGLLVVISRQGAEGETEEAHIPWPHTPDGASGKKARKKKYKAGSCHGPAICMSLDKKYPHAPAFSLLSGLVSSPPPFKLTSVAMGQVVTGFVTAIHPSHGAFVSLGNHLTGLVPTAKGGADLEAPAVGPFKVTALDKSTKPPRILLKPSKKAAGGKVAPLKPGQDVGRVEIVSLKAERANVKLLDTPFQGRARIHWSLYKPAEGAKRPSMTWKDSDDCDIVPSHPFSSLKEGNVISGLRAFTVDDDGKGKFYVDLTNVPDLSPDVGVGDATSAVVDKVTTRGLMMLMKPGKKAWLR